MSAETRLYPGDREPRAIKLRKPRHTARNVILIILAAVLIIGVGGFFAWKYFGTDIITSDFGQSSPSESSSESTDESSSETSSEDLSSESSVIPPASSEAEAESGPEAQPVTEEDSVPRDEWYMILVNKENPLPEGYSFETKTIDEFGHSVDSRIAEDLEAMFAAGRESGLSFSVYTAYRTTEKQKEIFDAKVASLMAQGLSEAEADKAAEEFAARPGTSEHSTGLALDIVSANSGSEEESSEALWLFEHSWEYGFILRYPKDKEAVTGFEHEPWHYRYVGKEQAKLIHESGLCLEEYLTE